MSGKKHLPGERLVLSFPGPELSSFIRELLQEGLCGGVILFSHNYRSLAQMKELVDGIRECAFIDPPLLMVDQEGGRVQRFRENFTHIPSALEMATSCGDDKGLCGTMAELSGRELRKMGINVNLAPVLDVLLEKNNSVIGDRSFGSDPHSVAKHGLEYSKGLEISGICPVGKHFPGHGMTIADSHQELPLTNISREDLMENSLHPFREAVAANIPALMTAHVVYKNIDASFPGTLSKKINLELLRGEMGFEGALLSDDLNMRAISSNFSNQEVVARATSATVDILIHCGERNSQERLLDSLIAFYRQANEELWPIHERIDHLRKRIIKLNQGFSTNALKPDA